MNSVWFTGDELVCPNCDNRSMKHIAGSEHESPVAYTQLWECTRCEYQEER